MKDISFYIEKVNNDAESALIKNRQQLLTKYAAAGGREKYKAARLAEYKSAPEKGWTEKIIRVEDIGGVKKAVRKVQLRSGKQNGIGTSNVLGLFPTVLEAENHAAEIGLEMF
jgi:hypothetical protein